MDTLSQHLRLLLIIAIAMSPVQPLFAMQTGSQADGPMASSMRMSLTDNVAATTAAVSNIDQNDASKMLNGDCNKRGKCSNCQGANHCSSCPLSLGIPQVISKHAGLNTQVQFTVPDASLHSTDLLPDYRPPRYS